MIKRLSFLILMGLLTGCIHVPGPGMGSAALSHGRECYYGYRGHDLHFLIVTDGGPGSGGNGVRNGVFAGPCWSGKIKPVKDHQPEIAFKVGKNSVHIGGQKYCLKDGRAFVVSTKKRAVEVRQLKTTSGERIKNIVDMAEADKRFDL